MLLLAVAGVAVLVLGEVAVRLYLALPPSHVTTHVADPDAGFRIRPGYGNLPESHPDHINSLGFRDVEHGMVKSPGTLRILGIGDSFVYGVVPPDENFLRIAAARLDTMLGDTVDVEMVMMGLGGYSPENEAGLLRSLGLSLDPDIVVICFFVGNDVTGIPVRAEVLRGKRYFTGSRSRLRRLARRSRLFLLTEFAASRIKDRLVRRGEPATAGGSSTASSSEFLNVERARLPVYERHTDETTRALWREAEGYLRTIDTLCTEAHVPWMLLVIPSEIQVDADVRRAVIERLGVSSDALDVDAPQRRLERLARELDVPVVDPLARMREAHGPDARLYVPNDTHWNARGNALAGEILADALRRLVSARTP